MSDLKDKKANKGSKTFFNLKIRGDPLPEVKWFLNDVEVVESDIFHMSCKEEDYIFRLDILDVQSNTAGTIKVVAKNENGEDTKIVSVSLFICLNLGPQLQGDSLAIGNNLDILAMSSYESCVHFTVN